MNFWIELLAFPTLFIGGVMMTYSFFAKSEPKRDRAVVFGVFIPSVVMSILTIIYR